jgi:hypothetical protein
MMTGIIFFEVLLFFVKKILMKYLVCLDFNFG